jgi:hypothetical protein
MSLRVLGAINGLAFQQLLLGAILSATLLACAFEAWSTRAAPVRSKDEGNRGNRMDG